MKRREFISLLGGAAAAWPLAGRAEQRTIQLVGILNSGARETSGRFAAIGEGLNTLGYIEGQNFRIEARWANDQYDKLPALAMDLVEHRCDVIIASGNVAARAAKQATSNIPIIFHTGDDPVSVGLMTSVSRPDHNITGISAMAGSLPAKRLELLHELVPAASAIGVLLNPKNGNARADSETLRSAARVLGVQLVIAEATNRSEIDSSFVIFQKKEVGTLLINSDATFTSQRKQLIALAEKYAIPTIYVARDFVDGGGLISYGTNFAYNYRQVGIYAGRILKGEKLANLPVMQPTKFELVINLKTAKSLGIEISPTLLTRADEVIE